ncbi:MAG TPA: Hsp20/alpha crystallin family protein [Vicinamibacterales bacterium]|jgi:HSP20 family protein
MALVRWNALNELAGLEVDRLNRMFSDFYSDGPRAWVPPVDIYETEKDEVVIKVELPDMKKEDIRVTFENDVLTIAGERKFEESTTRDRFQRIERRHGAFSRAFTLPTSVDASQIAAAYKDGVLTVTLPRREESKPKQIAVTVE